MSLEERIGYTFQNRKYLKIALSHSSYINEEKLAGYQSNERLEFLGDSVLSLVTSEYLYKEYRKLPEGKLTKIRASVVCERSLCEFSRAIGLGEELLLGRGEEHTNGRDRDSILADAFEALLAAIYLDGGMECARTFALRFLVPQIKAACEGKLFKDYKTTLQEIVQKNHEETLSYRLCGEEGPDHAKRFSVEVLLNSNVIGEGHGRSKKEAEQMAAKAALRLMGE